MSIKIIPFTTTYMLAQRKLTSNAFICIIYKKKNKYRETKQQTMKLGDLGKQNHPPKPEKKL
ncbi:hypothetical protein ES332_D01G096100v1 [Gossypium tomentosum]|uniref:Uncharacterized protein n=1 Tax=Gossypium tomentosum TaxID=34277 RepID=A0A5D2M735_GOSTO|nr:hypothetical protein ES332_D01G096100v1 [Gossypium tomentosum]